MRVIIKPAGMLVILGALAALAFLAFSPLGSRIRGGKATSSLPPPVPATKPTPDSSGAPRVAGPAGAGGPSATLLNGDFEAPFAPIEVLAKKKGDISGSLAPAWFDNSEWADVTVRYAAETDGPYAGKRCQRIDVKTVHSGQVQFAQQLKLAKGRKYRAAVWVRASQEEAPAEFGMRMTGEPRTYYTNKTTTLGTTWKKIEIEGTIGENGTFLMLVLRKPGITYWVDDATLVPAPEPTPASAPAA